MSALFRQLAGSFCLLVLLPTLLPACGLSREENSASYSVSEASDAPAEEEDETSDHFLKFFVPATANLIPQPRALLPWPHDRLKPGICLEIPTPPPLQPAAV